MARSGMVNGSLRISDGDFVRGDGVSVRCDVKLSLGLMALRSVVAG
jgi:hypothetical protein